MKLKQYFFITVVASITLLQCGSKNQTNTEDSWIDKPQDQWPQITMINQIDYTDNHFPVAGCGFLLDTGEDTLAVTAKHILTYFKSEKMNSVDFNNLYFVYVIKNLMRNEQLMLEEGVDVE